MIRRAITFAIDLALLLRVAAALIGLPLVWIYGVHWRDQRERRIAAGRCASCGYPLTGNVSGTCPECGGRATNR